MSTSRPNPQETRPRDEEPSRSTELERSRPREAHDSHTNVRIQSWGREKKKVGFSDDRRAEASPSPGRSRQDSHPHRSPSPGNPFLSPQKAVITETDDYFACTPRSGTTANTPTGLQSPARRDSFDRDELKAALSEILQPETHLSPPVPRIPRPVLRKPTAVDSPSDPSFSQPLRSELEAKDRADRLAVALSAPNSRCSLDDDYDESQPATKQESGFLSGVGKPDAAVSISAHSVVQEMKEARRRRHRGTMAQQVASDLVRSHTIRGRGGSSATPVHGVSAGHRSGTTTPIARDLEYVPRPEQTQGGILGNLLRLYGSTSDESRSNHISSAPSTPSRTPPTSAPGSPGRDRPSRPRSRLLGHQHTQSSSTLLSLIGSSTTFASIGTARDMHLSESVTEKVRLEKERNTTRKTKRRSGLFWRQEEEQARITKHIANIISRQQYLVKLCRALMLYGAPTHRLEVYMTMSARVLGINGQFLYLPGTMIISLDDKTTHTTEVKMIRTAAGVDLGRLREVHNVYKAVVHDQVSVDEATRSLDEVMARQPHYSVWFRVLLFGLASAMVGPFGFEARMVDVPVVFAMGCVVGYLQLVLAPSNNLYANVFEITASILSSFMARMFGSIRGGSIFCFSGIAQSSIALILPGYLVLSASLELQNQQMIAGSVRMVYAMIYSLFLGYGITIGSVIYGYMDVNATSETHCPSVKGVWWKTKMPANYNLLCVLPFTLCLCYINQAKPSQLPTMTVISLAGYAVNNFSSRFFRGDPSISNTLGALTIGVLANLYSRLGPTVYNSALDVWERHLQHIWDRPRGHCRPKFAYSLSEVSFPPSSSTNSTPADPEMQAKVCATGLSPRARKVGYGLAAVAMLPAIFVQVPGGLAANGSLLSGITSADELVRNGTNSTQNAGGAVDFSGTAFNVLLSMIQVAVSISVGLSVSALLVYPFGKKRSGLLSF